MNSNFFPDEMLSPLKTFYSLRITCMQKPTFLIQHPRSCSHHNPLSYQYKKEELVFF